MAKFTIESGEEYNYSFALTKSDVSEHTEYGDNNEDITLEYNYDYKLEDNKVVTISNHKYLDKEVKTMKLKR